MEHYAPIEFAARGQLTELDPLFATSDVIDMANYYDVMWEASRWQGKTYGIPAFAFGADEAMIIQVQACEEAGLDLDNPPQTWDELFDWADALTQVDDAGNLIVIGFDPRDGTADYPYCWANSYGMGVYDAEAQKFSFDDPRWVDIFNHINDWIQHWGGPEKFSGFRETYGGWLAPQSSFCQGTQVIQMNGYWSPGEIALKCRKDLEWIYTYAPRTSDRRDTTYQRLGGHNAQIPKDAKHPEAAFRFLEFLSTDQANRIVFLTAGGYVSTKSWMEKVNVDYYPGLEFYIRSTTDADELYIFEPCPVDFVIWDSWYTQLDAVLFGDKTAEEAAAAYYEEATSELEKALEG
jgi:multiple sugar transport system substrate-binding protein